MLWRSAVVISIRVEPRGMVQPITHNLVLCKQDGSTHTMVWRRYYVVSFSQSHWLCSKRLEWQIHMLVLIFANSEGIWNNYVDIQQKIMPIRFIIFLSTWRYNFLGDPTRQHEVWRKILLNTNSWYLTKAFKSMHTLFLLTKSATTHVFHWY